MTTLTSRPTLLGAGGGHMMQYVTGMAVSGGGHHVELTPRVMRQLSKLVAIKTCACGCGETFITTTKHQKFVDNVHRQQAYRNRKSNKVDTIKKCLWCGSSSNMPASPQAKFCSASHRTMSYRKQRQAMLRTFAEFSCVDIDTAHEIADRVGAKKMRLVLEDAGYRYDYENRVWHF